MTGFYFETGFDRGFATQTLYQSPKVKALLSRTFTFGLLKFASSTQTDVTYAKSALL